MRLWNVIKGIFCREKELYFTALGPSGAGKTSVLACMSKVFSDKAMAGLLTADSKTNSTLESAYKELEKMGNDTWPTMKVPSLVPGTKDLREHIFTISGIKVTFFDFPGGWMSSSGSDKEKDNYNKVLNIVQKSMVVIIAIDTPYIMEDNEQYIKRAKVSEVEHFLQSLMNSNNSKLILPKLILLVPIKCEKYTRNPEDTAKLHETIKNTYKQTVNMVTINHPDRLALAMMPIHTIGNIEFARFDKEHDGEIILRRNNEYKFAPRDADQPLRYAVNFLLKQNKHYWKRNDMKRIAEIIEEGIHTDRKNGFEIIHGYEMIIG